MCPHTEDTDEIRTILTFLLADWIAFAAATFGAITFQQSAEFTVASGALPVVPAHHIIEPAVLSVKVVEVVAASFTSAAITSTETPLDSISRRVSTSTCPDRPMRTSDVTCLEAATARASPRPTPFVPPITRHLGPSKIDDLCKSAWLQSNSLGARVRRAARATPLTSTETQYCLSPRVFGLHDAIFCVSFWSLDSSS